MTPRSSAFQVLFLLTVLFGVVPVDPVFRASQHGYRFWYGYRCKR